MEERIRTLFDYQRFEPNEALSRLIMDTKLRYAARLSRKEKSQDSSVVEEDRRKGFRIVKDEGRELSEEELSYVNAAGSFVSKKDPEDATDE